MNETPKPINPMVHTATRSAWKLIKIAAVGFMGFIAVIFFILGSVFATSSYGSVGYSESAEAKVTSVNRDAPDEQGKTYCTYNYAFTIGSNRYTGKSSVGTPESCSQQVGNTVGVKYDKDSPSNNSANEANMFYTGVGMLVIAAIIVISIIAGLIIARQVEKRDDRNNDGLFNDDMPATTAQVNVIDSGMRDLGEFWVPHKMTQLEAREVIRDINAKLADRTNTPPNPES